MEYSIAEVAKAAGVSRRTLRHYDDIGLLPAERHRNGYRGYGRTHVLRLQRILLLRDLGLPLTEITAIVNGERDDAAALRSHLNHLHDEQERLARQIASVQRTISHVERQEDLMIDEMFDGFDHRQYREEVEQRWGAQAWARGDAWWSELTNSDKQAFTDEHAEIAAQWAAARAAGAAADSPEVHAIAARHAAWIAIGWQGQQPSADALVNLADMYVADERFAANYGGVEGAGYVRDGLVAYALTLLA